MPELPEVETTVRAISKFKNSKLKKIIVHNNSLRWKVDNKIEKNFKNLLITDIYRRAKYIILKSKNNNLILHLGMSGRLRIQKVKDNYFLKHDHIEFYFENEKIIYNDARRFGSLHQTKNINTHKLISKLGPEPLSKEFNKNFLFKITRGSNICIKKFIMDQSKVVGVGNIYASESLFLANIHPLKTSSELSSSECDLLTRSIKKILKSAIKKGGTTIKDFYSADGSQGYFSLKLKVYDRYNEKCFICKSKIEKIIVGQRSTFFCNLCQK